MENICGDTLPEQLHRRPVTVFLFDAGTTELKRRTLPVYKAPDFIFIGRIETALLLGDRTAEHPIGTDNAAGQIGALCVDDQKVIANLVETVEIPAGRLDLGRRDRGHFLVENAIAQGLRSRDLFRRLRHACDQVADMDRLERFHGKFCAIHQEVTLRRRSNAFTARPRRRRRSARNKVPAVRQRF